MCVAHAKSELGRGADGVSLPLLPCSVYYFTTAQPGSGIFLPLAKAIKRDSPTVSTSSFPPTPASGGLRFGNQHAASYTPPTPGLPRFSQSAGPGRAPSPLGKKVRPSLPRPESPVRRLVTPSSRPSLATPASKAVPQRFGSPTSASKFAHGVRSTSGDPSKRLPGHARKGSVGPRSVSALGTVTSPSLTDDETNPMAMQRNQGNGTAGSVSSFAMKVRPDSRAGSQMGSHANDEEVERLRAELEDRDRQLQEQATALAEMESSLTELQGLIENSEAPLRQRQDSIDDKDVAQLRALVREKNDKIAMLTAEFDAHRADFRSTIDTLELASAETERVYEKRIEELMQEIQELQDRTADVDTVAAQLKQLEELVQELEEGLEDARRGEAEARGEVEFLRGEVERTRAELRREREKAQSAAMNGANGSVSKELEQKEDEIRGLKAIIHSLSRDSVPGDNPDTTPAQLSGSFRAHQGESIEDRLSRERLEREVAELRALVESKTAREEELERELEALRRGNAAAAAASSASERSSIRDSRATVTVVAPRSPETQPHKSLPIRQHGRGGQTLETMAESDTYSTATENSTLWCEICETSGHDILSCTNVFGSEQQQKQKGAVAGNASDAGKSNSNSGNEGTDPQTSDGEFHDANIKPAPLSPVKAAQPPATTTTTASTTTATTTATATPASTSPAVAPVSLPPPATDDVDTNADVDADADADADAPTETTVRTIPNPMDSGPVAGKESGTVDASKWCALCERDGHDSVDCPFEDAF